MPELFGGAHEAAVAAALEVVQPRAGHALLDVRALFSTQVAAARAVHDQRWHRDLAQVCVAVDLLDVTHADVEDSLAGRAPTQFGQALLERVGDARLWEP